MKKILIAIAALIAVSLFYNCTSNKPAEQAAEEPEPVDTRVVLCETEDDEILKEIVDSAANDLDVDVVSLYVRNKHTGEDSLLLTTVKPEFFCWYIGDGNEMIPWPIDSLPCAWDVKVFSSRPLQLIVEGCYDFRNIMSYFIDVDSRKAWYIPANNGYLGTTSEERFMVFQSYRYARDGYCGRHTVLQIFDPDTLPMIASYDLEDLSPLIPID